MSNHTTEELLLAGMERFTADVTAPPKALVANAAKRNRRRRIVKAAATGGTAVTAAAVIAAVAAAGPAPAGQQAQTTAYVVGRTESALATSSQNLVEAGRVTTTGQFRIQVIGSAIAIGGGLSSGSTRLDEWSYGQRAKFSTFTAGGTLGTVSGWDTSGKQATFTGVDYQHKTWWARTTPALTPFPGRSGCAAATLADRDILGLDRGDVAASLRTALRCGDYTLGRTELVDGVKVLELMPAPAAHGFMNVTFWVDPATYLPVRSVSTLPAQPAAGAIQVDFRWLPPTTANVAKLAVTIPPGFTKVTGP